MTGLTPKKELPEWASVFLGELASTPNVSGAAAIAGVTRQAAYKLRAANSEFAALWNDAIETAVDDLESRAFHRAKDTSDTLAIFLLKAHRPHKYRDMASVSTSRESPRILIPDVDDRFSAEHIDTSRCATEASPATA